MPRKKLQKIAETTYHTAGITVDLFFDPNSDALDFHADYAGVHYSAKSKDELHQTVYKVIKESTQVVWEPVIQVKPEGLGGSIHDKKDVVGFSRQRFYLGRLPDGTLREVAWGFAQLDWLDKEHSRTLDQKMLELSSKFYWAEGGKQHDFPKFHPPCHNGYWLKYQHSQNPTYHAPSSWYLPYTEQTWNTLEILYQAIQRLREQLQELLSSPERIQALTNQIQVIGAGNLLALSAFAGEVDPNVIDVRAQVEDDHG